MSKNAQATLIKGLQSGFAGKNKYTSVKRGTFLLQSSEFSDGNNFYIDQYIAKRTAGGQEIAKSDDETVTRVYAGGIVKSETVQKLGISEEQIIDYLKSKLSTLTNTRLHEAVFVTDGDWQYAYSILKEYPDLPLTIGVETIGYKDQEVFVHIFLITPIE